jgi:hypothetical protein
MGCKNSILKVVNTTGLTESKNFQINENNCQFKEIITFKDFEIKNGVLGLDRDVYLSLVKFLDSSILRKV